MTVESPEHLLERTAAVVREHLVEDDRGGEIPWRFLAGDRWIRFYADRSSFVLQLGVDTVSRLDFNVAADRAWLVETLLVALANRGIRRRRVEEF